MRKEYLNICISFVVRLTWHVVVGVDKRHVQNKFVYFFDLAKNQFIWGINHQCFAAGVRRVNLKITLMEEPQFCRRNRVGALNSGSTSAAGCHFQDLITLLWKPEFCPFQKPQFWTMLCYRLHDGRVTSINLGRAVVAYSWNRKWMLLSRAQLRILHGLLTAHTRWTESATGWVLAHN